MESEVKEIKTTKEAPSESKETKENKEEAKKVKEEAKKEKARVRKNRIKNVAIVCLAIVIVLMTIPYIMLAFKLHSSKGTVKLRDGYIEVSHTDYVSGYDADAQLEMNYLSKIYYAPEVVPYMAKVSIEQQDDGSEQYKLEVVNNHDTFIICDDNSIKLDGLNVTDGDRVTLKGKLIYEDHPWGVSGKICLRNVEVISITKSNETTLN